MAHAIQITVDAADPRAQGTFWCEVLAYIEQPPPPGFAGWEEALDAFGIDQSDPNRAFGIVDPDGVGPRVFFLKVPEGKSAKNRMHLDVHSEPDRLHARAAELVELGATSVGEFENPKATGSHCSIPKATSSASTDRPRSPRRSHSSIE